MPTLAEIETAYDAVKDQYGDIPKTITAVLKKEIDRLRNVGRKVTSTISRKEQNRLAQQKWRKDRKLHSKRN